jgi:hypothetical protein
MIVPRNELKPPAIREPPDEARPALARLARLRSQVAAWFWVEGLARVLWLALAISVADLAIDWLFRLDRPQRTVMLALMLAAIGFGLYRWLWRPLQTRLSDEALALAIESAHPRLGQSFVTALQLIGSEAGSRAGVSAALVRRAIELGFRQAQEISFASVVDRRRWRQNLALLAAAAVIWLILLPATFAFWPLRTWVSRNLLLDSATWPQQTYLAIDGLSPEGRIVAPRGEPWRQIVSVTPASRIVPQTVHLEFRAAAGRTPLPLNKIADRQFAADFAATSDPFELRARGGDAVTEWTPVKLVEPPALTQLKLVVTPPSYAGGQPVELAAGEGSYAVLPGSSLKIEGQANKPLARATLHYQGKRLLPAAQNGEEPSSVPHQVVELVNAAGTRFAATITADSLTAGEYQLAITDTLGLASREPPNFVLRKRIDQEPQLQVRLIGIGELVTPEASVPYRCRASDDFGLSSALVRYRYQAGEEPQEQTGHWPLAIEEAAGTQHETGLLSPSLEADLPGTLPLADLKLTAGTTFTFRFEAADNNDVTGPGIGRTSELLLRVVTADELRIDLFRREKQERQTLERLIKDQEDLITDNQALAAMRGADDAAAGPPADIRARLLEAEKRQKAIGSGVTAIARSMRDLAAEVQNNRLEEVHGRLQTRLMDQLASPLDAVAGDTLPRAVAALSAARQPPAGNSPSSALARSITAQTQAANQLKAVLAHMVQTEGFEEAIQLLYELEKAQGQVQEETSKARQEQIRRVLEGRDANK